VPISNRLIDLHLHTTASDGCDTPETLVDRVAAAGIRLFAVTDHDTVAALPVVADAAKRAGLTWLSGIEVTAIEGGRDVHVLGYGFDEHDATLAEFLAGQRASRLERLQAFAARFAALGMPIDIEPLIALQRTGRGRAVGRAHVARLLVAAGHVPSVNEAFDAWLTPGRPAFVPRRGPAVRDVVRHIARAGGITSLAHPRLLRDDALVVELMDSGVAALEAFHSEHDEAATRRYLDLARERGLAVSGGSDFHGAEASRARPLGGVSLPLAHYVALRECATTGDGISRWPVPRLS